MWNELKNEGDIETEDSQIEATNLHNNAEQREADNGQEPHQTMGN